MIGSDAKRRRDALRISRTPTKERPPPPLEHHASVVEQYAAMAHVFTPRPVDLVLRFLDLLLGTCVAVFTGPVVAVIAVILKLSSPRGPVLYRGWRVGRGGYLFQMLKFRTL